MFYTNKTDRFVPILLNVLTKFDTVFKFYRIVGVRQGVRCNIDDGLPTQR